MKKYTEEELKKIIRKKYHSMIDWEKTFFLGFDGTIELIDNGQATKALYSSTYQDIREVNWFLGEIQADPESEW